MTYQFPRVGLYRGTNCNTHCLKWHLCPSIMVVFSQSNPLFNLWVPNDQFEHCAGIVVYQVSGRGFVVEVGQIGSMHPVDSSLDAGLSNGRGGKIVPRSPDRRMPRIYISHIPFPVWFWMALARTFCEESRQGLEYVIVYTNPPILDSIPDMATCAAFLVAGILIRQ